MLDTKSQSVSQRTEVGSDDEPAAVAIIVFFLGIVGLIWSAIAGTQKLMGESDIFWFGLLMGLTAWATAWFYFSGKNQVLANGPFCPADRLLFQMLVVSILLSFGSFLLVQGNFLFGLEPNHLALWAPPINIVLAVTTVLKSQ